MASHANETGLRKMLGNLIYQTRPPDEVIVLVSGVTPAELNSLKEDFSFVTFLPRESRNDWGHEKRSEGVELASKDWLGFFDDDDSYSRHYLERMFAVSESADVVYCSWNVIPRCQFALASSTSGNFIVRSELAKRVGYMSRAYEADGRFIEALKAEGARVNRVDELLYFHNVQP